MDNIKMAKFSRRDVSYSSLDNEAIPLLGNLVDQTNAALTMVTLDHEHEDASNVHIIHKVPKNKGQWTHIEDLDTFFTRMYRYYVRGGFYPMILSDLFSLLQFVFIIWFSTFLVHCVDYPRLFKNDPATNRSEKLKLNDVIYSSSECVSFISWTWWSIVILCAIIWVMRLVLSIYHLYYAYDTKLFYNNALHIKENDLAWITWPTVQERVREAQREHHMCVHKQEIDELDIYHRILRINNYMVAMVNKNLLPLQIHVPLVGEVPYLSRGLKWNLEFLLFSSPWSPWENCWQLREDYKDNSKRIMMARQIKRQIMLLAFFNFSLAPFILVWQILYIFFNYAELVKRSPASLGLRTWSPYARITLRHFNELEHELHDRLTRAHKPASKYLASFTSPTMTVVARHVVFLSGSVLGVLVMLSIYDEDVLTVEHVLSIITLLGCVLAGARALIGDEEPLESGCTGPALGEELFVQVLGHVHYLPANWRGRAHTKDVAGHFQLLFQYRAPWYATLIGKILHLPLTDFRVACQAEALTAWRASCPGVDIPLELASQRVPSLLEPSGLSRDDGKRPEGATLVPWCLGRTLVWDATCVDTLAPSHVTASAHSAGAAAQQAQIVKHRKYSRINKNYEVTLSVETLGMWSSDTVFCKDIGKRLVLDSGDPRAGSYFLQRLSLAIQRGNAASILGTLPRSDSLMYILNEALAPVINPFILFSLRHRAFDIVDFYRNFTVSVHGIGDVCSFAQLDIRRHGNPEWQTPDKFKEKAKALRNQYEQSEGGKTELSLVAFSCRHPGWQPAEPSQRLFLKSLRHSMNHAIPGNTLNKTMLGSYIQQSLFGAITPMPAVLSYYPYQRQQYRLPEMDETSDEEEREDLPVSLAGVSMAMSAHARAQLPPDPVDSCDMSLSTLHMYDLHLSQARPSVSACCTNDCGSRRDKRLREWASGEETPLLRP